jgi:hypothetical protein
MKNTRGFERKGKNNNHFKLMLRSINVDTNRQKLKKWLVSKCDSVYTSDDETVIIYKGKEYKYGSVAEAVYNLKVKWER